MTAGFAEPDSLGRCIAALVGVGLWNYSSSLVGNSRGDNCCNDTPDTHVCCYTDLVHLRLELN